MHTNMGNQDYGPLNDIPLKYQKKPFYVVVRQGWIKETLGDMYSLCQKVYLSKRFEDNVNYVVKKTQWCNFSTHEK